MDGRCGDKGIGFPFARKSRRTQAGGAPGRIKCFPAAREADCGESPPPASKDIKKRARGVRALAGYQELYDFQNLYAAYRAARRGKGCKREVIEFELNLAENLCVLKRKLEAQEYLAQPYYHFTVYEPKRREIHALHYADRVVQHCLCDNIIAPQLEPRLIFDNAACRKGKGTHFAMYRLTGFLQKHYRQYGANGYVLKADFARYFENIDHAVLRERISKAGFDADTERFLNQIIDSYSSVPGKGLPLGNQSSQWFALYYLDPLDRMIKERFQLKGYTRYMDDLVLLHESKDVLRECLSAMKELAEDRLRLRFNEKTQLFPLAEGLNHLGFHFRLTNRGSVIRTLRSEAKHRLGREFNRMRQDYLAGLLEESQLGQRTASYLGHLKHGKTFYLQARLLKSGSALASFDNPNL
jgi:hypothetical protein